MKSKPVFRCLILFAAAGALVFLLGMTASWAAPPSDATAITAPDAPLDAPAALTSARIWTPWDPTKAEWRSGGPYLAGTIPMTPTVVLDVEASPHYAGDHTLFAATRSGLFRTVNGGDSWQLVLGLPHSGEHDTFSHVRLSPAYAADGVVIAAYADAEAATSTLFQSGDFGATWQPLTTFTQTVTALAMSPNYTLDHTLFAILGDGTALHKSTDGGQSWQPHRFGPEDYFNGFALAISPAFANDQTLFATGFGAVHRSTDGGLTWSALNTYGVTYGLAISPAFANDRTVWATYRFIEGPGDGTPENSVMRSFDGGANWMRTATGLPGVYEPFARVVAVAPTDTGDAALFTALSGQLLAMPNHSLFRSDDRGASWVDLGMPPANPDIYAIAVTSTTAEGIVAHVATAQGVWQFHTPCEQRIVNAGFEYDSGWDFPLTAYSAGYSTESKHSGARSARMGIRNLNENKYSYSSAQQTVRIPSDAVSVTLTLWWNAFSGEAPLPAMVAASSGLAQAVAAGAQPDEALAGDRQYVLLLNEQGGMLEQLLWTRRNDAQWQPLIFDLTKYAGKTVRLHFGVYNDGVGGVTSMFVDDVALTTCPMAASSECRHFLPLVCGQPVPAPTPTPTLTPTLTPTPTLTATPTLTPTPGPLWPDPPAAIEVFAPLANERYRTPIDVNGFARTFEGNVYLRLVDAQGNLLAHHRARGGMTSFDFFHGYLRFEVTEEMTATLQVYQAAAADQPPISRVEIPLTLEPGQRFVDLNAPAPGSNVCGRVPVQGYSNTFEATVVVELTGRDGSLLEQTNTMGGNLGLYAEFATYFSYDVTAPREALVGAMEISPRDGVPIDHVRVPVSLYPAGHSACR